MSVRGHVVVDVYEFGGVRVVVGDHVKMKVVIWKCDGRLRIQRPGVVFK